VRTAFLSFIAGSVLLAGAAIGQNASAIVEGIPANVTEVTTGGAWTSGDQTGAFRVIVITGGDAEPQVSVYVQLVSFAKTGAVASILKTTSVSNRSQTTECFRQFRCGKRKQGDAYHHIL